MDSETKSYTNRVLPSWLWFWLIVYLLSLPTQISQFWLPMLGDVFSHNPQPGETLIPFSFFFRVANFVELAPLFIVALGVLMVFIPRRRIKRIQQEYGLEDPPDVPAVSEISEFLSKHAPGLVIKANLLRSEQIAFIYPIGYRTSAIALFGGIVKLWRNDRQAAEAVLLHESAHYRQGDALVLGVGSFFVTLLNIWLPLVVVLVFLPMVFVWGYDAIRFVFSDADIIAIGGSIRHKTGQLFILFLPDLFLTSLSLLFWTASILILPIVGIWCAELNADRFVIDAHQSADGLMRGITTLSNTPSWKRWLLFRMSHPPNELRRWFAFQSNKSTGFVLLLLLFPLTYIIKLVLVLGRAIAVYVMYKPVSQMIPALMKNTGIYLKGITAIWLAMIILILLWPRIVKYWEWLFCRVKEEGYSLGNYQDYVIADVSLVGVWIVLKVV